MNYFLAQANNSLVHLPDLKIEIGKREIMEIPQIGAPSLFVPGNKLPDTCIFTKPNGSVVNNRCQIVEETGKVYSAMVASTEIGAHSFIVLGIINDIMDVSTNEEAMLIIKQAISNI